MAGVFHNYDIRGIFGKEIDSSFAFHLGMVFAKQYKPKVVVVGHDERIGSDVLSKSLIDSLVAEEIEIINIGLCTTPMVWHAVNHHKSDGGIMVTASHNPKEYVGFKLCTRHAIPIGYETGLSKIEEEMTQNNVRVNVINEHVDKTEGEHYKLFSLSLLPFVPDQVPIKIVADCSNSAVAPILVSLFAGTRHDLILLNETPDGNFQAHEPNPMIETTTIELSKRVVEEEADFGVIFDGDADRVVFVDEKGNRVRQDTIIALIGRALIVRNKDSEKHKHRLKPTILADLRSSKSVEEQIVEEGGQLLLTKVGRPHIISQLHASKGLFAGELSGHYYYQDFYCCDDGVRTLLEMMQIIAKNQQRLSELAKVCDNYARSGEVNIHVKDAFLVLDAINQAYSDKKPHRISNLDGISVYFEEFWFNVRASNTEPLLRLNMEANTKEILEIEFVKLMDLIKQYMR